MKQMGHEKSSRETESREPLDLAPGHFLWPSQALNLRLSSPRGHLCLYFLYTFLLVLVIVMLGPHPTVLKISSSLCTQGSRLLEMGNHMGY